MTSLLPELEDALPPNVQLDGELVAFDVDGKPDFHRLSERMLHRREGISIAYKVFDVVAFDGESATHESYRARRQLLEALSFDGARARVVPTLRRFGASCRGGRLLLVRFQGGGGRSGRG
jgi:ATP-dependent DNA ligase